MTVDESRAQAQAQSIARGFAIELTSPEGETSRHYFATRTAYECCITRGLDLGYRIEAITATS